MSTKTTREYNLGEQGYGSDLAENFCKLLEAILPSYQTYRYGYIPTTAHDTDKTGDKFTIVQLDGNKRFEIGEVEEGNGYSCFVLWTAYSGQPVYGFKEVLEFFSGNHGLRLKFEEQRRGGKTPHDIEAICWDVRAGSTWLAHVVAGDAESNQPEVYSIILDPQRVADAPPRSHLAYCLEKGDIGYCWHLATMHPELQESLNDA